LYQVKLFHIKQSPGIPLRSNIKHCVSCPKTLSVVKQIDSPSKDIWTWLDNLQFRLQQVLPGNLQFK